MGVLSLGFYTSYTSVLYHSYLHLSLPAVAIIPTLHVVFPVPPLQEMHKNVSKNKLRVIKDISIHSKQKLTSRAKLMRILCLSILMTFDCTGFRSSGWKFYLVSVKSIFLGVEVNFDGERDLRRRVT